MECKVVIVSTQEQNPKTDPNYGTRDFSKAIYSKYYKHNWLKFWHMKCVPTLTVHFKASFVNVMLINFFVWKLQCIEMYEQQVQFCTCFAHKNIKNPAQSTKKTAKVQDSFEF